MIDDSIAANQHSHILSVSEVENGFAQLDSAHPGRLQIYTVYTYMEEEEEEGEEEEEETWQASPPYSAPFILYITRLPRY